MHMGYLLFCGIDSVQKEESVSAAFQPVSAVW